MLVLLLTEDISSWTVAEKVGRGDFRRVAVSEGDEYRSGLVAEAGFIVRRNLFLAGRR
jgi:hypothetical protein